MSRSFMDAIRGVVLNEGAKDKTSDGMTKDAKHFVDLHRVNDVGTKYLAQNDGERKTYEKMFNGDVDRAPSNHSSNAPGEDLDKYVEYNEHVEIEEAKKAKKCDDDCECEDCSSDDKEDDVKEAVVNPMAFSAASKKTAVAARPTTAPSASTVAAGTSAAKVATNRSSSYQPNAGNKIVKAVTGSTPTTSQVAPSGMSGSYTGSSQSAMASATKKAGAVATGKATAPVNKTRAQAAAPSGTPTWGTQKKPSPTGQMVQSVARDVRSQPGQGLKTVTSTSQIKPSGMSGNYSNKGGSATNMAQATKSAGKMAVDRNKAQSNVKVVPTSGPPPAASSSSSAAKPAAPAVKAKPAAPSAAKPATAKPAAAAPSKPTQSYQQKRQIERGVAPAGTKGGFGGVTTGKNVVQKAQPKAKAPVGTNPLKSHFEFEVNGTSYLVSEAHASAIAAFIEKHGMVNEGTAGEFIHKEMEHPEKLTAKGKKQKIKQALAIFYSKKRRGENP